MRLTGSTPSLTSVNILNRSEKMKNILPMSVDNSRKKTRKWSEVWPSSHKVFERSMTK